MNASVYVLETIYEFYTEDHAISSPQIRARFRELEKQFAALTPKEHDQIFDLIGMLCYEYEKCAFLEGMRVATALLDELKLR